MYDQELPSLPVPGFTDQHTDLKAFVALILKDAKEGSYHFYDFDDDLIIDSNHITNTHDWEKLEALFSPYSQVPTPKPALFLNRTVCESFELPSGWQEKSVSMISLRHTLPSMNLWLPENNPYCIYNEDDDKIIVSPPDHRTGKPYYKPHTVVLTQDTNGNWTFTPNFCSRSPFATHDQALSTSRSGRPTVARSSTLRVFQ